MAKEYRNQTKRRSHDFVFWRSLPFERAPSNVCTKLRFTLTTSSGKRAGNFKFLEKYFGARSPQTLLLRTFHLLSDCSNCRHSIRRMANISSSALNRANCTNLTVDSFLSSYWDMWIMRYVTRKSFIWSDMLILFDSGLPLFVDRNLMTSKPQLN